MTHFTVEDQVKSLREGLEEEKVMRDRLLQMNQGLLQVAVATIDELRERIAKLEQQNAYLAGFHQLDVPGYPVQRGDADAQPCDDEADR